MANKRYRYSAATKTEKRSRFAERSIRQTVACAVVLLVCLPLSSSDNSIRPYIAKTLVATSDMEQAGKSFVQMCKLLEEKHPVLSENVMWQGAMVLLEKGESEEPVSVTEGNTSPAAEERLELVVNASEAEFEYPENVNMVMPLKGEVTSGYGKREHPVSGDEAEHYGVDIAGNCGDAVISTAPGRVIEVRDDDIYGKCVLIQHTERIKSFYAHLDKTSVEEGDIVAADTKIGEVGSTGVATGPHLHFGVRVDDKPVDPEKYISMPHRLP